MKEMSGAEILIESLNDLGVRQIFGYTGASILPVFCAIEKSPINIIINSNEQSSAFSAAGESRSSDRVGVAIVTSGPAITNTLTAVADAYCDSVPLIVIAGQVPEHKIGTDSFQHINVQAIFGDTAKKVIQIKNNQDIEFAIKDAYYFAKSGKPGPVVIDFPLDAQQRISEYKGLNINHFKESYEYKTHLSREQCKQFFELLKESKKPLMYIGGGLNSERGCEAFREFKKYFDIPTVHTLMGKGIDDERCDTNLGMLGMFGTPPANKIIQENDFFFALGVRWDDRVAEKVGFAIDAKIAYVDINPVKMQQIRIERRPEFTHTGDASIALKDLLRYAKENNIELNIQDWQERARELKRKWPLNYNREADKIQAGEVMKKLMKHIDEKTKITTGVGNHQMLAAQYLPMQTTKSFLTSGSYGTMGFALPSAIGAQKANPDAKVIAIDGDGSIKMNFGELHTIATLKIPIKIIMINNASDGMVVNLQDSNYNNVRVGTEREGDVNFSNVAKDLGFAYAARVSDKNKLDAELANFLKQKGPCFLEVITDREEVLYPKVPIGSAYKDMILGPYIKEMK